MKRLLIIALAAPLPVSAAAAYDAAKCTQILTGKWLLQGEGANLTLDLAAGGAAIVTLEAKGETPDVSKGVWSAQAGAGDAQCVLKTAESADHEGDVSVVSVKDDKTIELAEVGVFTRQ